MIRVSQDMRYRNLVALVTFVVTDASQHSAAESRAPWQQEERGPVDQSRTPAAVESPPSSKSSSARGRSSSAENAIRVDRHARRPTQGYGAGQAGRLAPNQTSKAPAPFSRFTNWAMSWALGTPLKLMSVA